MRAHLLQAGIAPSQAETHSRGPGFGTGLGQQPCPPLHVLPADLFRHLLPQPRLPGAERGSAAGNLTKKQILLLEGE